ncbi:MAG: hypothetical protein NC400_01110 [Clostridium sp.]|nr:hypothetical protein [Clostridium sp.]
MQIGAVSFRPYIYNTNRLSGGSLSKISAIGDDLTSGRTDFSELEKAQRNENPLRKGETINFGNILERQMWLGRQNASRFMKTDEDTESLMDAEEVLGGPELAKTAERMEAAAGDVSAKAAAAGVRNSARELNASEALEDFKPAEGAGGIANGIAKSVANSTAGGMAGDTTEKAAGSSSEEMIRLQSGGNLFQIQRAIEAYQMNMTA